MSSSHCAGETVRTACAMMTCSSPWKVMTMWECEVPLSSRVPTASKVLTKGNGGSWGVVSIWASPVAGMTRDCLSRMMGLRSW